MPRMLKELERAPPEAGFLGHNGLGLMALVQYWRSFEHLEKYAHSRDHLHWPAWVEFNRQMKDSEGDVGIWHETYCVRAGEYEAIYRDMPLCGLAKGRQPCLAHGAPRQRAAATEQKTMRCLNSNLRTWLVA
jgi:hypothetical protein